jgi:hypothetical protein
LVREKALDWESLYGKRARLAPAHWLSGDRLRLIASFGHRNVAIKELEQAPLAGEPFRLHRCGAGGGMTAKVVTAVMMSRLGAKGIGCPRAAFFGGLKRIPLRYCGVLTGAKSVTGGFS